MALLEVDGLTKSFGGVTAIADLRFEVPEGQVEAVAPFVVERMEGAMDLQVDLVVAEGAPDMARPARGFHPAQQRVRPGPDHGAQIVVGFGLAEEPVIRRVALKIGAEPGALAGSVVKHNIEHEIEVFADGLNVAPVSQCRVDFPVVNDRKTLV